MPEPTAVTFARAAVLAFFALLAALIVGVNWGGQSIAISGDEPHYLIVVNSLLRDHDLELDDGYRRVARGAFEAGVRFRGALLDHHTVLFDRQNGVSKLWQDVFDWRVRECHVPNCEGWRRISTDFPPGQPRSEVSAHPVAFPVLLALVLAPFRLSGPAVEPAVNVVIVLLCWLGAVLVYLTGRAAGFERWQACLAAALLGVASPWLAYSRSFFVEIPAGFALILGLYGMQRGRPVLTGIAAGIAFALKPPFLFFGAAWIVERWWVREKRDAVSIAIPFAAICFLVGIVNRVSAGRWIISGTSEWEWAYGLSGLHANLFDSVHGLIPFAPWVAAALLTWIAGCLPGQNTSTLVRQVALPATLYLALLSANAYLGQTCYGPRYWVAALPLLALLSVETLRRSSQAKAVLVALLFLGSLGTYVALPGAFNYSQLWDRPAVWMRHATVAVR